ALRVLLLKAKYMTGEEVASNLVISGLRTSLGSWPTTASTRERTSSMATLISDPISNVAVTLVKPSRDVLVTSRRLLTPEMDSSTGRATRLLIVSASAPG